MDLEHCLLFNILCIVHVHDVVTDWSYALVGFLVSTLFCGSPGPILAIFHIANVFLVGFPFFFNTSGTSRGSTEVQEEKTGLIRYLLEYLWTNNYSLIC